MKKPRKNSWFTARVLVRLTVGTGPKRSLQFEDRFILVSAPDSPTAKQKAKALVKTQNSRYKNSDGEWVSWNYSRVVDTLLLFDEQLVDGTEVWYRFIRSKNPMKQIKKEHLGP